jgi:hypothetical protein
MSERTDLLLSIADDEPRTGKSGPLTRRTFQRRMHR